MIDSIAQEGKARGGTEREKAKEKHVRPVPKKLQFLMIQREFGLRNFLQNFFSVYT